jgi:16S rRNA (guanine527-N7)-methyltransferase
MQIEQLKKALIKELDSYPLIRKERFLGQINILANYIQTLCKWSQRANLVGKKDPLDIFNHLIIDSLFLVEFLETQDLNIHPKKFLDIGAGAGIPGIPFRIFYQEGNYLMVEPRKKRHVFINLMIKNLYLKNTNIYPKPIEQMPIQKFDICLSRALCHWKRFLEISYPFLKPKGHVIIFSNTPWEKASPSNYNFILQYPYILKTKESRYFWLFSKKAPS